MKTSDNINIEIGQSYFTEAVDTDTEGVAFELFEDEQQVYLQFPDDYKTAYKASELHSTRLSALTAIELELSGRIASLRARRDVVRLEIQNHSQL